MVMHSRRSRPELDILLVGPVPPPFGGVSVHLARLVPLLENAGLRVGVLNHFSSTELPFVVGALKRNPLNYFRLPKRFPARVVHYHHSHWSTLIAFALGKRDRNSRYMVTLHSHDIADQLNSRLPLFGRVVEWSLRRFDAIIVVNSDIKAEIEHRVRGRAVYVVPAFLEAPKDEAPYDLSLENFLSSGRILLIPAYRVQFLRDGREMYGLDTGVEAFAIVAQGRPELRLALFIAERSQGRKAAAYLASLERRLEQAGLGNRGQVSFGLPFIPALRHNVIVVRPSRSDGDALTVREALHAGVPVVASDVVKRPAGTVTFPVEDVEQLCTELTRLLDLLKDRNSDIGKNHAELGPADPFLDGLMRAYRDQLASSPGARP